MTYDKLKDPRHVEPVLREAWSHEPVCWYCEPPRKGEVVILTNWLSWRRKASQRPVLKIFSWVYEVDTHWSDPHWSDPHWSDPLGDGIYIIPRFSGYPKLKR